MEPGPSLIHALGALLLVLGLIALVAWLVKRFAFGGSLLGNLSKTSTKRLLVTESLWLDARYRLVVVKNGEDEHTLLLGPQHAMQLENKGQKQ